MRAAFLGGGLVLAYTALISSADAITKFIAQSYAAPQLFALSGMIVAALSLAAARGQAGRALRTGCPRTMATRAAATVAASLCFFHAFRLLPFADVFVFVGLMPIVAAVMSSVMLREHPRPAAWAALLAGFVGLLCLMPGGVGTASSGHLWAVGGVLTGTFSLVLSRYIGRFETNALAQVFYPNLALGLSMSVALPFVWVPMPVADLAWVLAYAGLLFAARWLLVVALRLLAAYVVTPLLNLQFVWMVGLGAWAFGEWPEPMTWLGVAIVMGSGLFLLWDQVTPQRAAIWRARTDP
ncbi:DMT family transporter [Ruegeria marina]|uniref:EamA-like transporter family protein n=1 Tax=Ruegeria marina TaxID=639004 RepID=A0A1G6JUN9_9RHOB|nr:DMT family transporter [Ruegeria marina]SDC21716.1 EamA-like transporter family protein [Ruegeria marina]